MVATTYVISNNKGGVGKTAVATQVAFGLARAGQRVLVVDLDPQANASRRLGWTFDRENPVATISEAIKANENGVGEDVVVTCSGTHEDGSPLSIDLIPSRADLENRISEAGSVGAQRRLVRALTGWADMRYDFILIDTPPSLGHLTQLGFAAANGVLVVTEPEFDSVESVIRVRDFIEAHAVDLANPSLYLAGIIVSRYRSQIAEHKFQVDGLEDIAPGRVLKPVVPERSVYKDAAGAAVSVTDYRTRAGRTMTEVYDALTITIQNLAEGNKK